MVSPLASLAGGAAKGRPEHETSPITSEADQGNGITLAEDTLPLHPVFDESKGVPL